MTNKHFGLSIIIVAFFTLLSCTPQKDEIHHGSYEAMRMFSAQRAYPDIQIPSAGYQQAHAYAKEKLSSANQFRNVKPWKSLGPHNIAGRTLTVALNPQNPKTLWAGSASGGLWRSYNRGLGVSWERVEIGHPVLSVSSIAFAPGDSSTMYIGTGEVYNSVAAGVGAAYRSFRGFYGMGILKSTDGGRTWEKSLDWSYSQERGVWKVEVAPTNKNVVYAATTQGTYKSINAGFNWVKVNNTAMAMDLVVHPEDFETVFIGCGNFGSSGKGIYRTIDGGQSWVKAGSPIPSQFQGKIMLDISTKDPNIVYASIGNGFSSSNGYTWLCKSENGGDTWNVLSETDYSKWQGWFSHDIAIHPEDPNTVIPVGITIYRVEDGVDTIRPVTFGGVAFGMPGIGVPDGPPNFTHSDHHDVIYDPTDPNIVYVANDGGVYLSFDGGWNFQSANGGYQTVQFYNGFSVAQDISNFALGGLQDNSTIIYHDSLAWRRVIGGDGGWTAINPNDHLNHFGSSQYLNVYRTTDGGDLYNPAFIPGNLSSNTVFIAPYVISNSNPNILYAGRTFVYKSIGNGDRDWVKLNQEQELNGDPIFCMEVSPTNENVLYAATAPDFHRPSLFVTKDGGQTFSNITPGLPNRFIIDLAVDPNSESTVLVALGGFGISHVFRSADYGETWKDVGASLPDVPTSAVIVDPENSHNLYVGNDLGVFFSSDLGETWQTFNDGFIDAAMVMDLKIQNTDRKLYVATHGSGAYQIDLVDISTVSTDASPDSKIDMRVFPNPFTEKISISLPGFNTIDVTWRITNMAGQIMDQSKVQVENERLDINGLRHFSKGNYILEVRSQNQSASEVLIKSN